MIAHAASRVLALALAAAVATGCATAADDASDARASEDDEGTLRSSLSDPLPESELDAFAERARWIDMYGEMPGLCIARRDAQDGRRTLFHGCYDWHSSVHAHFAVLRTDLTGSGRRPATARSVDARLLPSELAKVGEELAADRSWENPYGRAWLLRLATEHDAWTLARTGTSEGRLRALADANATVLLDTFATRDPDPKTADYRSDAWALAQLVSYARTTRNADLERRAVDLVERGFAARPIPWAETNDADPNAFLSTYWSQVHTLAITFANDPARVVSLVRPEDLPDEALTPLPDPGIARDVHHLGINWSRAWSIKALARSAQATLGKDHPTTRRLVAAYHAHVLAGRERHFRYRGDYFAYDHWVPQFALYAITEH